MNKILRTAGMVLIVLAGFAVLKNAAAKAAVENGVRFVTGLKLEVGRFDASFLKSSLEIRDLRLFNPPVYPDKVMLEMPEIYVDYEMLPFFRGKIHLEEVRLHLKELVVVKNQKGEVNLDSLKAVESQKKEAGPEKKKGGTAVPPVRIDTLTLKIEKVVYKDYSKGAGPSVKEFRVHLDESYSNITNPYAVVSLIVVKALMNTGIAALTHFDLRPLESSIPDLLASSRQIAGQAVSKVNETLLGTTGQVKGLVGQAAPGSLKEAAGSLEEKAKSLGQDLFQTTAALKEKLKMPFEKKE